MSISDEQLDEQAKQLRHRLEALLAEVPFDDSHYTGFQRKYRSRVWSRWVAARETATQEERRTSGGGV